MRVAVDASVLVGLINPLDHRRLQAMKLRDALIAAEAELVYFDCVVAEAISTVARRLEEKTRHAEIKVVLDRLNAQIPTDSLTWILPDVPRLFREVLEVVSSSSGALNFNNALIALACRERGIEAIASFDEDFDKVGWLYRLAKMEDLKG
jgi:predicted nucleic acid-binding protein